MAPSEPLTPPGLTTERTLRRVGPAGRFRTLSADRGEPVTAREELAPAPPGAAVALTRLLHLTDFQLADLSSPARLEYLQRLRGQPRWSAMLPSYRPQEFTASTLVEAMARGVRALAEAERPIDLVITTGDNVDSQQCNELHDFVTLMTGGELVHPLGEHGDRVTSALAAAGREVPDWATVPGAPTHPELLAQWARPFTSTGVGAPWVACYGNHDALVQGRAPSTPALERLLAGAVKPTELTEAAATGPAIDAYVRDPTCFHPSPDRDDTSWGDKNSGDTEPVAEDVRRRTFRRAEFVRAQRGAGAPEHAYWAEHPHPALTVLVLDTTNPGGYADGSIGAEQLRWLVGELAAAHSRHLDEHGRWRETRHRDRAVVLCSHHGLSTLNNGHVQLAGNGRPIPGQDLPRALAPELAAVLGRFPNVVLWLSGHIHRNRVRPVHTQTGGYWEVATSAMVDWPCQARCIDLSVHDETLRIRCRQLDHHGAADPLHEGDPVLRMASIGRRLAANVLDGVGGPDAEGTESDRNVDLFVPLTRPLAAALRETATPHSAAPHSATPHSATPHSATPHTGSTP